MDSFGTVLVPPFVGNIVLPNRGKACIGRTEQAILVGLHTAMIQGTNTCLATWPQGAHTRGHEGTREKGCP